MEERFVDVARELNCRLGSQHVDTVEVEVVVVDAPVGEDHEDVKIAATSVETADISPAIVVAEVVAGNFRLCVASRK